MITAQDLANIAHLLVERHGAQAAIYAEMARDEMLAQGDDRRADNWAALGAVIEEAIEGRLPRQTALH